MANKSIWSEYFVLSAILGSVQGIGKWGMWESRRPSTMHIWHFVSNRTEPHSHMHYNHPRYSVFLGQLCLHWRTAVPLGWLCVTDAHPESRLKGQCCSRHVFLRAKAGARRARSTCRLLWAFACFPPADTSLAKACCMAKPLIERKEKWIFVEQKSKLSQLP